MFSVFRIKQATVSSRPFKGPLTVDTGVSLVVWYSLSYSIVPNKEPMSIGSMVLGFRV